MDYPQAQPRDPYIWVTWLSRLLAGESLCAWAAWFKAHHVYKKRPSGFDFAPLNAQHSEMVLKRKEELTQAGYTVFIENQNKFDLTSRDGRIKIGGRPDLVAVRDQDYVIEDCKTRAMKYSHYWQVLTYMLLLPHAIPKFQHKVFRGRVVYHQAHSEVHPDALSDEFKHRFRELVNKIGGDVPPARVPSPRECGWCEIAAVYCPERIEHDVNGDVAELDDHDLF